MRILKWLAAWLVLAIVFGAVAGQNLDRYYRLKEHGIAIEGIAHERRPHGEIAYSFEVNGQTYEGVGRPGIGAPSLYGIAMGDKVPIHYLPAGPNINCMGDPQQLYSGEIAPVLLVSLVFPTMTVCVLAYKFSKSRSTKRKEYSTSNP